jgi:hypothetical protein
MILTTIASLVDANATCSRSDEFEMQYCDMHDCKHGADVDANNDCQYYVHLGGGGGGG